MAGQRSHPPRALPVLLTGADRRQGIKGALFHTLPGRAIVTGLAIKLSVWLVGLPLGRVPAFLGVIDTVAGLTVVAALAYFVIRLLILAKRRLLWRVRRKLILSYIFVGFVPVMLVVAFFLLCGFLLFYNFSSYLVQSQLRELSDRARAIADSTAVEIQQSTGRDISAILRRREATLAGQYPDASMAVVPVEGTCGSARDQGQTRDQGPGTAPRTKDQGPSTIPVGRWAHVDPPAKVPAWIGCSGVSGIFAFSHRVSPESPSEDTHLLIRAVGFPDANRSRYGVIVDLLVNETVKQQMLRETGVELKTVSAVPATTAAGGGDRTGPRGLRIAGEADARPVRGRDADRETPIPVVPGLLSSLPTLIGFRDWSTGASGTLMVTTGLSVPLLYERISAAQGSVGPTFGQGLLLVLFVIGALFLIIEFIALVVGLVLAKSITGSVHQLFTGTERVRQGDFTHKIDVRTEDQLGELAGSFNSMTASIEDLLRQAAEKKRLEEELRIAHEIQMSLLPQGPLVMRGLSVTALCVPAREVGGDYYDFLPLGEHRLGVLIADVSGKGTSAALYMAELKGLVLSLSETHKSPRDLLISANRLIAQHLDARSFITMTYAVIDVQARTMTYARAGHTPLIFVPGPGAPSRNARILAPDGLVLGLKIDHGEMFERLLEEETIPLETGDLCLFFTDGISEAMNAQDDCFGETRLGRVVESHANLPSDELRERVLREISAFVDGAPQHDDMTMILLKVEAATDLAVPAVASEPAMAS